MCCLNPKNPLDLSMGSTSKALKKYNDLLGIVDHIDSIDGVHLKIAKNIHAKTLTAKSGDVNMIAEGSFNWFSAVRGHDAKQYNMKYQNYEATFVFRGKGASEHIDSLSLDMRSGERMKWTDFKGNLT